MRAAAKNEQAQVVEDRINGSSSSVTPRCADGRSWALWVLCSLLAASGCTEPVPLDGTDASVRDSEVHHDTTPPGPDVLDSSPGDAGPDDAAPDGKTPPVCRDDGEACVVDDECCGVCHYIDAVCYSPNWLSCDKPVHAVLPAGKIDMTPGGKLRYLLNHGYQGDIYDAHAHIYASGETAAGRKANGEIAVYRPISIEDHFRVHDFFVSEHLHIKGGANLILPHFNGLGDPSSTFQYKGKSYHPVYRPFEAGTSVDDDQNGAFSGANVLNAYTLYTKLASYVSAEDRYRYFAFPSLDWDEVRQGILSGKITSIDDVKTTLAAQMERMRDIGFDGIKFKSEWFPDSPGGAMRSLTLLETLPDAGAEPWEIDGEMFHGPGGILDTAARLGMPVLMHAGDCCTRASEFWGPDGIWATVLKAHPGLKLQIAHGFAVAWAHDPGTHAEHKEICNQRVQWMLDLFDRFDGRDGRSMLRIDVVWHFMDWWREHNELYQQGHATDYDYRALLINYSRHLMLGLDPSNRAAADYQSDGCGNQGKLEGNYLTMRVKLEGPYLKDDPQVRFLDLVKEGGTEGETLDNIYRNNLLDEVSVDPDDPDQVGPAGVDANSVRRIDCNLARTYVQGLRDGIRPDWRGTTPATDALVRSMQETLDAIEARCAQ